MNNVVNYKYKVSIILPCYNVACYIDNAVNAILKQTFTDYEVIFINDGSIDNTLEIIKRHCSYDQFKVFDFPNQGVAQARNEGIKLSQGEYIYFMDPDDDIDARLLEISLEECEKNQADAIQFHYKSNGADFNGNKGNAIYEGNEILKELVPRFIGYSGKSLRKFGSSDFYETNEWASVWRFLFKTSVIKNNHILFPKGVKMSEDRFFILKFLCYANKVVTIDKQLYHYIVRHSGCMSQGLSDPQALIINKMDGIRERRQIREMFIQKKNLDVLDLYSGSLILSMLELYVKLSNFSIHSGWKAICCYCSQPEVKKAIEAFRRYTPPLRVSIPLFLIRMRLGFLLFAILWLLKRFRITKFNRIYV